MITGRINAKANAAVPPEVLAALGVKPGDRVAWRVVGDHAVLVRLDGPQDEHDRVGDFSAFTEWADELDSVYDDL